MKTAEQIMQLLVERKLFVTHRSAILEVVRAGRLVNDAAAELARRLEVMWRCGEVAAHLTNDDEREGVEVVLEYQEEQGYQCIRQLCDDFNPASLAMRKTI